MLPVPGKTNTNVADVVIGRVVVTVECTQAVRHPNEWSQQRSDLL
jgi:hypothetical protein